MKKILLLLLIAFTMTTCKMSYSFSGSNIDYKENPTIYIRDFQNQAPLVYPPLTQTMNG
mgnify:CR=1 FL=1